MRFIAAEITREQCFLQLHQELPYELTVFTEHWQTKTDGSALIHQVIYIKKEGQKEIVLGKGGRKLKQINIHARRRIRQLIGAEVHLFLHVKVKKDWTESPDTYGIV